jgi:hypothetical protein
VPAEQARGHEQRRIAEAKAGADHRLEQGSAGAGDARRHVAQGSKKSDASAQAPRT